jgi:hypothetical protein
MSSTDRLERDRRPEPAFVRRAVEQALDPERLRLAMAGYDNALRSMTATQPPANALGSTPLALHMESVVQQAKAAAASAVQSMSAVLQSFYANQEAISRILSQGVESIVNILPDLRGLTLDLARLRAEEEAIRALGLSTLVDQLPAYLFYGVERIDPQVRNAWLTKRLLPVTRSNEFGDELEEAFTGSKVLSARWPAVAEALSAHREDRMLLSIPVLLSQIEGIVGDALILKGVARPSRGRLYAVGLNGKRIRTRDGKMAGHQWSRRPSS